MLLAARTGNKIPLDRDYIQRSAYLVTRPDIRPLVECGFAEILDDSESVSPMLSTDASTLAQDASNITKHARPEKETEKEEEKEKPKATSAFVIPEWVPQEAWKHYEEMRRKIRKPMTDQARKWAVAMLGRLRATGHDPGAVLEQSVFNSWQGLFEVRHDGNSQAGNNDRQRPSTQVQRWNNNLRAAAIAVSEMDGHSGPDGPRQAPRLSSGSSEVVDQET